jgi:hypothetical protein
MFWLPAPPIAMPSLIGMPAMGLVLGAVAASVAGAMLLPLPMSMLPMSIPLMSMAARGGASGNFIERGRAAAAAGGRRSFDGAEPAGP